MHYHCLFPCATSYCNPNAKIQCHIPLQSGQASDKMWWWYMPASSPTTRVIGLLQVRWPVCLFSLSDLIWLEPGLKEKSNVENASQCWLYCICICICICISGLAITDVFPDQNRWGSSYNLQHHCICAFFSSREVTPPPPTPPLVISQQLVGLMRCWGRWWWQGQGLPWHRNCVVWWCIMQGCNAEYAVCSCHNNYPG